jgi:hypothetical protein
MVTTPAVKQPDIVNHNNNNANVVPAIEDDAFQDQFDGITFEHR